MSKQKGLAPILIVLLIALAVSGYLLYQQQSKPVVPQSVTQPSANPTTSSAASSSADTTNWKTYTNNSVGLSFLYPSDVVVIEEKVDASVSKISIIQSFYEDRKALSDPELGAKAFKLEIDVRNNATNLTVQQVVDAEIATGLNSKDPTRKFLAQNAKDSIKPYAVGNVQGIATVAGEAQFFPLIYVVQNGKIYKIYYRMLQEDPSRPVAQLVIDQILSTFRFD